MSSRALSPLTAKQLFPPRGLVGEQSNAYRILLRYDRKSRHRRIKKQRRYERLAATSQFRTTKSNIHDSDRVLIILVDNLTLSGGRSPYLKLSERTHTLASVGLVSIPKVANSAADYLYSIDCYYTSIRRILECYSNT